MQGNHIAVVRCVSEGNIWIGTRLGGVSRYDGNRFVTFRQKDGLAADWVSAIHQLSDGVMWFGTWSTQFGGLTHYDGKQFVTLAQEDGLASHHITSIYSTPDTAMWVGTDTGISRWVGNRFVIVTTADGLASNNVLTLHRTPDELMWFGTSGGGASIYDGIAWSSLDIRDGLIGKNVATINHDAQGVLWFGTEAGITRFRRNATAPTSHIVSITTAAKTDVDLSNIPTLKTGSRVTIKYNAIDFKTLPEKRQYRLRIRKPDDTPEVGWHMTKESSFDHTFKRPGHYIFEVQSIGRDLMFSAPVRVVFRVIPIWYLNGWIVVPSGFVILAILTSSIFFGSRYYIQRREAQQMRDEMLERETPKEHRTSRGKGSG